MGLLTVNIVRNRKVYLRLSVHSNIVHRLQKRLQWKNTCELVNGELKLKTNHHYYYQIQGQMAVCKRPWCDFVVWTMKDISIQRIEYDYIFWETSMLPHINSFYVNGIIPELFSSRVKRGKQLYI